MPVLKVAVKCIKCKKILYYERSYVSVDDIVNLDHMSWSDLICAEASRAWTVCEDCEKKILLKKSVKRILSVMFVVACLLFILFIAKTVGIL